MMSARGARIRLSIASTTGIRASATNRLIATSRITSRTRQTRYRTIAAAATINTIRITPPSEGGARRTSRARVGARAPAVGVAGALAAGVGDLDTELPLSAVSSGRRRGEAVPTGSGRAAVVGGLAELPVDGLREVLDLEREHDPHDADGDGPDPADGDDRRQRCARVGQRQHTERD